MPRPIGGSLPLQKCHTARISGVDDCRRKARALAFLAATVRPHGRGECSCERAPAVRSPTAGASFWPTNRRPPPPPPLISPLLAPCRNSRRPVCYHSSLL